MPISQETIELVRSRARIEEVVSRYVPTLKKKGANWVGLCPFHKEKAGSFTVSPDKNMFYCFGCHAGGNVFSFIEKIENLNFPQAVKFIGRLVGLEAVFLGHGLGTAQTAQVQAQARHEVVVQAHEGRAVAHLPHAMGIVGDAVG